MDRAELFELRAKVLRLEALADAALALTRRRVPREIAAETLERALALLDAGRGLVHLSAEPGFAAEVVFAGRFPKPARSWPFDRDPLVEKLVSGESVVAGAGRLAGAPHRSLLGVPLRAPAGIVGAVVLFDRETREDTGSPFGDDDVRFLGALAALGGTAVEAARRLFRLEADRDRLLEENRRLRGGGEPGLVGAAPSFARAVELARRAAQSRVTVLLRGESGTGKERFARLIHGASERHDGPFVAVNCSAIPDTLLEAELFGIEKGVATGVDARTGRFELAEGGTLFLDEIGDLPGPLQAKLLRVLAEREVERIGAARPRKVDVRIVAATHRPLERMVSEGRFREDLYYRLRVVEIGLPALRERREDLPVLIRHFLRKAAQGAGVPEPPLSREAMLWLLSHEWPGNVRELENLLEGAVALSAGAAIGLEEIRALAPPALVSARPASEGSAAPSPVPLRQAEREHVVAVLRMAGGNKSRAARLLGVDRKTVDRILSQKGASGENFHTPS